MINCAHKKYQLNIKNSIDQNSRKFWSYANRLKKNNSTPDYLNLKGRMSSNYSEASELFADYFSSVYEPPTTVPDDFPISDSTPVNLNNLYLSSNVILNGLSKLKSDCGSGPDGVPNHFL